ncbi:hypothetical protein H6501_05995 [Candidatus Woesearchaeota archaeon]|nr:hypothetical protein [Candidatus Woesearchaeota archaeon]USN44159.1 MAG: hypothetical protein H6500_07265 [Candidatus Woesearchaeota archaeon]
MSQRDYILEIPGSTEDKNTELGKFVGELSDLVAFKPGRPFGIDNGLDILKYPSANFSYGQGSWIDTERGKQKLDEQWWTELVSQSSFHDLEKLLQEYGMNFVRNTKIYTLCCEKTTMESESIFLFNYPDEKLLFVSSPVQLFSPKAVAYLPEFTQADERLERALVESMIDCRDNSDVSAPHTTYQLFPSIKEARKHIQKYLEKTIKQYLTQYEGIYNSVTLTDLSSKKKSVFSEEGEITDKKRVLTLTSKDIWLPQIVKTYLDGKVLVEGQYEVLPLSQYFDRKTGIKVFHGVGACKRCYKNLKERLKEDARQESMNSEFELTGSTATKIGYVFDPKRIEVRITRKNPIRTYKERGTHCY